MFSKFVFTDTKQALNKLTSSSTDIYAGKLPIQKLLFSTDLSKSKQPRTKWLANPINQIDDQTNILISVREITS